MSTLPLYCQTCNRPCVYDRCAPFGQGQEDAYAVAWRCPEGHGLSADVCPVGPLIPARQLCLNCGSPYPSDAVDAPCGACGLSRPACQGALGITDPPADPIAAAHAAFGEGLFRRGMAILNFALQERTEFPAAWLLKARFLNSIGFNSSAAAMLGRVSASHTSPAGRISLLEEHSFLLAECGRGEEALGSAEAAQALGSNSVRTHYLRGRALALLGRLEEARAEMNQVLALDPQNADARRARKMIDEALQPTPRKAWWQFWK